MKIDLLDVVTITHCRTLDERRAGSHKVRVGDFVDRQALQLVAFVPKHGAEAFVGAQELAVKPDQTDADVGILKGETGASLSRSDSSAPHAIRNLARESGRADDLAAGRTG